MSDFVQRDASTDRAALDPTQHVHYVQGMVLGVDDFNQEFAYLSSLDQRAARDLAGSGTVRGLRVRVAPTAVGADHEVIVCPGEALTPLGRLVRVPVEQYARVGAWITANSALAQTYVVISESAEGEEPTATLPLHVLLAYEECLTDPVPVPGEPCRTEEDSLQPSRVTDGFRLRLSFTAPAQPEAAAVRALTQWLRDHVEVTEAGTDAEVLSALDALRVDARGPAEGFPAAVDGAEGCASAAAPPGEGGAGKTFHIPPTALPGFLRGALRAWTTELRPRWHLDRLPTTHGTQPADAAPIDEGVLLATVRVPMMPGDGGAWVMSGSSAPALDESERPSLPHLQMLQELAFHPIPSDPSVRGDVTGKLSATVVTKLQGKEINVGAPAPHSLLRYDGSQWNPVTLGGDVAGPPHNVTVTRVQHVDVAPTAPVAGQMLVHNGTAWTPTALAGDVGGTPGATAIVALQGKTINAGAPAPHALLRYDGGQWNPVTLGGDIAGPPHNVTVTRLQRAAVADTTPQGGEVLFHDGETWAPVSIGGDLSGAPSTMLVTGIQGVDVAPGTPGPDHLLVYKEGVASWMPTGLGGDLYGAPDTAKVTGLQGTMLSATSPDPGQVLFFDGGSWAPSPLLGDIQGPANSTTVMQLRGTPLDGMTPIPGQVLTFDGIAWKPQPPGGGGGDATALRGTAIDATVPAGGDLLAFNGTAWAPTSLSGDVSGTPGMTTVEKLRGTVVSTTAPTPDQVLTFVGGEWKGQAPAAVLPPTGTSAYKVVAAGVIPITPPAAVGDMLGYGAAGLRAIGSRSVMMGANATCLVEFTFDGYAAVASGFTQDQRWKFYVVKATPLAPEFEVPHTSLPALMPSATGDAVDNWVSSQIASWATLGPVSVGVEYFSAAGIVLRVMGTGNPIALASGRLMIEVSTCPDFAPSVVGP